MDKSATRTSIQPIGIEKFEVALLVLWIAHDEPSFYSIFGLRANVVLGLVYTALVYAQLVLCGAGARTAVSKWEFPGIHARYHSIKSKGMASL
jgi:hypothetical protein